jgi:hypothetical protein
MKSVMKIAICMTVLIPVVATWGQNPADGGPAAGGKEQMVAQLKQAMAANRAKLMKYQWVRSTEVNVKGKTRKDVQAMCRYGQDGKVACTPMGSPEAKEPQRGLKGKMVEHKVEEMKDYTDRLKNLIGEYVPPQPQMIQQAKESGNANISAANGVMSLVLNNYYKPGDKVTIGFDRAAKKLVSYDVNTYLDNPTSDKVTMTNQFASLPDGTNHVQQTVVNAQSKELQVTTTNSDYQPVGP